MELRIDVTEGQRYRVASLTFEGNKIVRAEGLRPLFKVRDGDYYSDKVIRKGYEKARELYGSAGYYQFNLVPMVKPHVERPASDGAAAAGAKPAEAAAPPAGAKPKAPEAAKPSREARSASPKPRSPKPPRRAPGRSAAAKPAGAGGGPAADPAGAGRGPEAEGRPRPSRASWGRRWTSRCSWTRASSTSSTGSASRATPRRATRSCAANSGCTKRGVFNTEALKFSIKRVNQLAYFKPLEGGKDVDVKETPGADNKMDITLKFEEQNRNQLQFGAGVSQYRGVLRDARLPDRELHGPRRDVQHQPPGRVARAELRRWPSPSRTCSTGRSPAGSTSSSGAWSTSGSSRRTRSAGTSSSASR